jgi:hypothetical protein
MQSFAGCASASAADRGDPAPHAVPGRQPDHERNEHDEDDHIDADWRHQSDGRWISPAGVGSNPHASR